MVLLLLLALATSAAISAGEPISPGRIRAHVKFLSSDLLEGRGVGQRGGALATAYLATQFALAGAKPSGEGDDYFQHVPLVGVGTDSDSTLTASAGPQTLPLRWLDDFAGSTQLQLPVADFSGEVVFAGYGITAPEFGWDDFAGADVSGKVLLLFANEPPSKDPKFFGGEALTYYGRWTYKFEQASRKGAIAAILVHTDDTAGYGWDVVRSSWGREAMQMERGEGSPALTFAGWVTREAAGRLLSLAGRSVDELLKLAGSRGFRAVPLGIRLQGTVRSTVRRLSSRNVAALVPGSDPQLRNEAVVFTAHWDHLGIGQAVEGDPIYNGAVDNATGCAMLLEIARAWALLERKPRRGALFLSVTAEESGLLGSRYHVGHPVFEPSRTAAALNLDSYFPWGLPTSIVVNGAERTTLWPLVRDAARRFQLNIKPDPRPRQGSYFRSDHFPFAEAGIPAFSISMGGDFSGKAEEEIGARRKEFSARHYHRPSDEYHEEWDFAGLAEIARFAFLFGRTVADLEELPTWNAGDPLLEVRRTGQREAAKGLR